MWHTAKYIQLKTLSGSKCSHIEIIKQEVLKEETESLKQLNYPIINMSSEEN